MRMLLSFIDRILRDLTDVSFQISFKNTYAYVCNLSSTCILIAREIVVRANDTQSQTKKEYNLV